jgi:uncharacterized membrane protein YedE/YeeE
MKALATTFFAGLLVALGMGVAGMTQPTKLIGFLDFTGAWDPSLLVVLSGAVLTFGAAYKLSRRRTRPFLAPKFAIPTRRDIDFPLVVGASLFGIGWGITGICPGLAIIEVVSGSISIWVFLSAMVAGMVLFRLYDAWSQKRRNQEKHTVSVAQQPETASA